MRSCSVGDEGIKLSSEFIMARNRGQPAVSTVGSFYANFE